MPTDRVHRRPSTCFASKIPAISSKVSTKSTSLRTLRRIASSFLAAHGPGFTDNYMECMVPTVGVYPIATANDKSQISAPLMSRFAVIDIPDYTSEEKKIIFSKYVLPKVLKRMSLKAEECVVTEEGLNAIVELHKNTSGIRDLEQAAEHIAANALYQIEVDHLTGVTFNAEMVRELLS